MTISNTSKFYYIILHNKNRPYCVKKSGGNFTVASSTPGVLITFYEKKSFCRFCGLADNAALHFCGLFCLSIGAQVVDVYGLGDTACAVQPAARLGTGFVDLYALH